MLRNSGGVCDRDRTPIERKPRNVWNGQGTGREDRQFDRGAFRPEVGGDHPRFGIEEADLFADGDEWHFGRDDLDLPWERIVGGEINVAG